jgi:hypothetical protein
MPSPVEFQDKYKLSLGLVLWFLIGAITATFSLTMIYNRFLFVEEQLTDLKTEIVDLEMLHEDDISYFNERVDRKVDAVDKKIDLHMKEGH